ncbi:MAG: outer membrane beta-barrel protein [Alphaproteobacteria bacterium]|nr:outer membrane beta-barrel protein [Alphaproteobacteria bacterium]
MAYNKDLVRNVKTRPSPHYRPEGGRMGVFVVRPSILVLETYDDNIYRDPDKDSDFITAVRPEVRVSSDWSLHGIEGGIQGELGRYAEFDSENYNDYSFYLSGRYDLAHETSLNLKGEYQKRHQERDTLEDPGGDEPMEYSVKNVFIGFTRELSLLRVNASALHSHYIHDDSTVSGTVIDNSIRDRTQQELDLRVAYGLTDNYEIYTAAGYDRRRYDQNGVAFRDSDTTNIRGGLAVNFTGKLRGDVYAGYVWQDFEQNFDDVDLFNYGGAVLWNPSQLTSVEAKVGRALVETVQAGASTIVRTTADASIAHAIRENVLGEIFAGYVHNGYEGAGASDDDNRIYKAGLSVVYKPTRNVSAGLRYDYMNRNFDDSARDYDNNKVMLSLRYEY